VGTVRLRRTDRLFGLLTALDDEPYIAQFEALTATRTLVEHRWGFLNEPKTYPVATTNPMKPLASFARRSERRLIWARTTGFPASTQLPLVLARIRREELSWRL
jgi:hypothetical protein